MHLRSPIYHLLRTVWSRCSTCLENKPRGVAVAVTTDLEGDMVVLGVDLAFLREAAGVLRLQQVDADPVVEQPDP